MRYNPNARVGWSLGLFIVQCLGLNVRHQVLPPAQSISGSFRWSIYLEDALNVVSGISERHDHRNNKKRKRKKDPREKCVKNVENEPFPN